MKKFDLFKLESRQMKRLIGGDPFFGDIPPSPPPGGAGGVKNVSPPVLIPNPTDPNEIP